MEFNLKNTVIYLLLLSLASCGDSDDKDTYTDYSEQYQNPIGKWGSNCFLTTDEYFKDPIEPKIIDIDLYVKETLEFTDTTFKATRQFYSDPSCNQLANYVLDPYSGETAIYFYISNFDSSDGLKSNSYKMEFPYSYGISRGIIRLDSKGEPIPSLFEKAYYFDVEKMYPVLPAQENLYVNYQIEYTLL